MLASHVRLLSMKKLILHDFSGRWAQAAIRLKLNMPLVANEFSSVMFLIDLWEEERMTMYRTGHQSVVVPSCWEIMCNVG